MRRLWNSAPGAPDAMAAPVGGADGATCRCRGCRLNFSFLSGILLAMACAAPVVARDIPLADVLPGTGLDFAYHDMIAQPPDWRVRYLVPELARGGLAYEAMAGDIEQLCVQDALPRVIETGSAPVRIVITLMSEPVAFGEMTPNVTQFFESFLVENDLCIWEAF